MRRSIDDLSSYSTQKKVELIKLIEEKKRRESRRAFYRLFPDEGPFRRELYKKHLRFFREGAIHDERCAMAGNRTGKTEAAAYEITAHLTGEYSHWWEGHRFNSCIRALAAGDTGATTRDIIQKKLLGEPESIGTGMIPGDLIVDLVKKSGLKNAYEEIHVRHVPTKGVSKLKLRSYDQGRRIFQGTEEDFIWFDEECPEDVYDEALVRTMTTYGKTILTFTPLSGMTPLVISFLKAAGEI